MSDRSTGQPWSRPQPSKGPGPQLTELKELVVGYAKQETVDPLKTLKRYLGFGLTGAMLLGFGLCLLLLALLRGLQQVDVFNEPGEAGGGTFGWVPYLVTTVVGVIIAGLFLVKLMSATRNRGTK